MPTPLGSLEASTSCKADGSTGPVRGGAELPGFGVSWDGVGVEAGLVCLSSVIGETWVLPRLASSKKEVCESEGISLTKYLGRAPVPAGVVAGSQPGGAFVSCVPGAAVFSRLPSCALAMEEKTK